MEQWKDILDFEENYQVSNLGRVRNKKSGRVLSPTLKKHGYHEVSLSKNGERKSFRVHRLVAIAFVENDDAENKTVVNHIIQKNIGGTDEASNLEWVAQRQNIEHEIKTRHEDVIARAQKNGKVVSKSVSQYSQGGEFLANFPSLSEASRSIGKNGSGVANIQKVCLGERKSAYGFIWKFID